MGDAGDTFQAPEISDTAQRAGNMNDTNKDVHGRNDPRVDEHTEEIQECGVIAKKGSSTIEVNEQIELNEEIVPEQPASLSKETRRQMVEKILETKSNIDVLLKKVRDTQATCERYEKQNKLLQDYVGSLMSEI